MQNATISALQEDTRTYAVDKSIAVQQVTFTNRYGFTVAGHLYLPKDFVLTNKYPAVVISGPFGAVKEQASGLYAQELAKNGFVTVAFDPSTTGESSGAKRNMGSPEIFTEDYSAAVDFITNLSFVNPQQVGALAICGLSGMAITAASNDVRIKAVVTASMYDMSDSIRNHYKEQYYSKEQRDIAKQYLAQMRDKEAKAGTGLVGPTEIVVDNGKVVTYTTMFPNELPKDADSVTTEFYNYYVKRAYHPRSINSNTNAWDSLTAYGFYNFPLMNNITDLSPRPVLFIAGANAHSKYFSDEAYAKANEPKELLIIPDATHTDLYDNMAKIPFPKIVNFFRTNLK